MTKTSKILLKIISLLLWSWQAYGAQQIQEVNYFASLRSNETNVRSGPGANYPIKFSFKMRNVPVKVVSEYDNWYEIEDFEGTKGWVMQSLITKKRHLMTYNNKKIIQMFSKKDATSRVIFNLENFIISEYLGCENSWCQVKINDKKGWVLARELFGSSDDVADINSKKNHENIKI